MTVRIVPRPGAVARDVRGATIVEFALVSPILLMIVMAIFDLGYRAYAGTMLQGALDRASRRVTIGNATDKEIDDYVGAQMANFSKNVKIERSSYSRFSQIGKPEKITTDIPPMNVYNKGDCFEDVNANGVWDKSGTGRVGTGGADDIVYYTATARFSAVVPIRAFLGWSSDESVTATAMVRNQPYATQPVPAIIC